MKGGLLLGRAPPAGVLPHAALVSHNCVTAGCKVCAWSSLCSFPSPQPPDGLILRLCPSPGPFAPTEPPCTDELCWRKGSRARSAPKKPRGPYLVIQHEQQSAFHIDVAGTLHLEAISLLGCGQPVPLQETKGTPVNSRSVTSHPLTGFVSAAGSRERQCSGSAQGFSSSRQPGSHPCESDPSGLQPRAHPVQQRQLDVLQPRGGWEFGWAEGVTALST